jgi:hypothetical protein
VRLGARRWTITLALLLTATSLSTFADDRERIRVSDGLDFAVPSDSPVEFASLGQYDIALFNGRFKLSGTYHYGYTTDDPRADASYGVLDLYFIPDKAIARRLPYWAQRGGVHEMRFRNESAFIKAVVPAAAVRRLEQRKTFSVSGRTSVVVESYQASVECDYATYSVLFVAVEHPPQVLASRDFVMQYGC